MCTIWLPIENYEGIYEVSSEGEVRYIRTGNILHNKPKKTGYIEVLLYKKGQPRKHVRVHKLIAQAFLPNPDNLPVINHKNGIKHDNRVENLEWCTIAYNTQHAAHKWSKEFTIMSPEGKLVHGKCIRKFSEEHGLEPSTLSRVISGKYKQHRGWRLP